MIKTTGTAVEAARGWCMGSLFYQPFSSTACTSQHAIAALSSTVVGVELGIDFF